jgi:hypothetical protein
MISLCFAAPSVANCLHTFENRYISLKIPEET